MCIWWPSTAVVCFFSLYKTLLSCTEALKGQERLISPGDLFSKRFPLLCLRPENWWKKSDARKNVLSFFMFFSSVKNKETFSGECMKVCESEPGGFFSLSAPQNGVDFFFIFPRKTKSFIFPHVNPSINK